jgi:thioredoxin reductase
MHGGVYETHSPSARHWPIEEASKRVISFLGQDGRLAEEIVADGKVQLLRYTNVSWLSEKALNIQSEDGEFSIQTTTKLVRGKRIILATGVVDI